MPYSDPKKAKENMRKNYLLNRDKRLVNQKEYHLKNKDRDLENMKVYRAKNKDKYNLYMKKWTNKKRQEIASLKNVPCFDCGNKFPTVCMDFDHREGEVKLFNIARLSKSNKNNLMAEISKCDIICANCHRIRTANRFWNQMA